jgi:hypothetical protein
MPVRVIVDTSVWSLFIRRRSKDLSSRERRIVFAMRRLIADGLTVLIGVGRQELLTGIRDDEAFERVREHLQFFDDEPPEIEDYELAASFDIRCRAVGVAASSVDSLCVR